MTASVTGRRQVICRGAIPAGLLLMGLAVAIPGSVARAEPAGDVYTAAQAGEREAAKPAQRAEQPGRDSSGVGPPLPSEAPLYRPPSDAKPLGFMPPRRGNPRGRIGGGTRSLGVGSKTPGLAALVPEHVARTISPQPSLFWYLTAVPEDGTRFVFTLIDDRSPDPVHEGTIPTPTRAGVQRVSLAERGLELELGVEYEWSVALVLDPERRSSDVVATGWIDRVPRPAELAGSLGSLPGLPAVRMYAESGLWYDAFGTLSDLIERDPKDVSLRAMRAALLEQAGLVEVAEQER